MISDTENNPVLLWAEIHRLRHELKGPDNFETWRDAAISERLRRVQAEHQVKLADEGPWQVDIWPGNRVVLQSHASDDVALEVSGNFATHGDKVIYATKLAANLNLWLRMEKDNAPNR